MNTLEILPVVICLGDDPQVNTTALVNLDADYVAGLAELFYQYLRPLLVGRYAHLGTGSYRISRMRVQWHHGEGGFQPLPDGTDILESNVTAILRLIHLRQHVDFICVWFDAVN